MIIACALIVMGCSNTDEPSVVTNIALIDVQNTQQQIEGFGGVNMPGWIPDLTEVEGHKAFGTGTGQIGLSILRIRVPYDSTKFSLEVPTTQLVKSLGVTTFFATPWTPPASMKSSNDIVGGILNPGSYAAYAAHLKSFADYMARNGVPLYAMSIQNEPDVTVTYESCSWNAAQMINFLRSNASVIGLRIMVPEVSVINRTSRMRSSMIPSPRQTFPLLANICTGGTIASYPLALSKGKEDWMTEHLDLDTTWSHALVTGQEIHACMNAGMNAYVWWYIRRYYGPIDENSNVTKRGYVMSQYARFVRPGYSRVVATPGPQSSLQVTAYSNGSKLVLVVLNVTHAAIDQVFQIRNASVSTVTPYVTSETENCVQRSVLAVSNARLSVTLDAESITTFVSN